MARTSKHIINKEDIQYICSLTEEDLLKKSVVMELFGEFNGKARFHTYDTITIPAGVYGRGNTKNKKPFTTTIGKYVFNKIFIERDFWPIVKWFNDPVGKKGHKKLDRIMSHAVMEDKLPLENMKRFLVKEQKMMPFCSVLMCNHTDAFYMIAEKIEVEKKRLLKKYEAEIKAGNDTIVSDIEKELIEFAKKELHDDGSLDMFETGEGGSYGNNFKNMFIMKGLVQNTDPTKGYNLITSDLMNGVSKEEYSMFAQSLVAGPYARSRKTATGGYWEKLFRAFDTIQCDEPGTDCHTKRTIEWTITKDNIDYVMYLWMVEGNKLIELTSENEDKYIGKTVRFRFTSLCESKNGKICSKCAGNKFYRLGIRNIGSAVPQIASRDKNINMKNFHDSQVVFVEMDPMKAFFPFGHKGESINEDVNDHGVNLLPIEEQIKHENHNLQILNEEVYENAII